MYCVQWRKLHFTIRKIWIFANIYMYVKAWKQKFTFKCPPPRFWFLRFLVDLQEVIKLQVSWNFPEASWDYTWNQRSANQFDKTANFIHKIYFHFISNTFDFFHDKFDNEQWYLFCKRHDSLHGNCQNCLVKEYKCRNLSIFAVLLLFLRKHFMVQ